MAQPMIAIDAIYEGKPSSGVPGRRFTRFILDDPRVIEDDDGFVFVLPEDDTDASLPSGWHTVYSGEKSRGGYQNARPYVLISRKEADALTRRGFRAGYWSRYRLPQD